MSAIPVSCPYCGEWAELSVDEGGSGRQSYIEDCPVCCQPWQVRVSRDSEDDWSATLQTLDE
ncbi:MAG TPA: CPXCG motif-containing cysteine-rich protein [Thermoanaerobaculia bacterium]|nr:CPXCG motif-containing cysteine-rich protein [Thermoanaerobaculia bacterium]